MWAFRPKASPCQTQPSRVKRKYSVSSLAEARERPLREVRIGNDAAQLAHLTWLMVRGAGTLGATDTQTLPQRQHCWQPK